MTILATPSSMIRGSSKSEFVRGEAHTNGIESFWSMLKRAHKGTFHKMSKKHLQRYVTEFVTRHNMREADTSDQIRHVVAGMVGERPCTSS